MADQIQIWVGGVTVIILSASVVIFIWAFPKFLREYHLFGNTDDSKQVNDSLTDYMSELSLCTQKKRITELCQLIREGNEYALDNYKTSLQKKQAQTVLTWLQKFSVDTHIKELSTKKTSSQISYNTKTKKYNLKIYNK